MAVTVSISADNNNIPKLIAALNDLERMYVKVGITSKADGDILTIAKVHEFGMNIEVTDKMRAFFRYKFGVNLKKNTINIPERSFIRTGFDANEDKIGDSMEDLIGMVLDGNLSARAFYDMLGQTTAQAIALHLRDEVNSPPNSGLTIQNKGSSNVLIDSGRLVGSIDYEVVG